LQALLPLDDYDAYLCGPRPFMQVNWRLLRSLGIARERIHYEFFGPATILDEDEATTEGGGIRGCDAQRCRKRG
jgi:ferredoxin-NADP reductase